MGDGTKSTDYEGVGGKKKAGGISEETKSKAEKKRTTGTAKNTVDKN